MHHDNCITFFRHDPVTKSDVHGKCKTPGQIAAEQAGQSAGIDPELLTKVLTNPEMAKLLKALAGTIE